MPPTVLIVDDSASVRSLVKSTLEEHGFVVDTAVDAENGAAKAFSVPYDVIVSDLWMPGLSGVQLCRLLNENRATAGTPVVLLSAATDRRARFWAERSGAAGFIDKRNLPELCELVTRLATARKKARAEASERPPPMPLGSEERFATSIAQRLSALLDRALFDSVVANEIRALSTTSSTVDELFVGLAGILSEVLAIRWIALSYEQDERTVVLFAPPDETRRAAIAERYAVEAGSIVMVRSGDTCVGGKGPEIAHAVGADGRISGQLAVGLVEAPARDDDGLIALAAREIGTPLRLVQLLAKTNELACTDMLTGLANRRHAALSLETAVASAKRYGTTLSVALLDIDHFKQVNDVHGHAGGDAALRHIGALLKRTSRRADLVARWGGEEFFAILPGAAEAGARIAGERVRALIAKSPVELASGPLTITTSIGLATWDDHSAEELIDHADKALYAAKRAGRNRVEVWRSDIADEK